MHQDGAVRSPLPLVFRAEVALRPPPKCGGSCTCATCLVHVDEAWSGIVGPPSADEEYQMDSAFEVKPTSRLSSQIKVTEELDGLVVHTPSYQGR